jgi:acyl-CoA reductase-like NAD-dependent aldehyde dehydrogenase
MSPSKTVNIDFTTFHNIVDGKQRNSKSVHNGTDPVTGNKLWDVPIATQQDVDDAVESAAKAFKTWSQTPVEKRKELMLKFSDLYETYEKDFADLMCKETGKPRPFAASEVSMCKDLFTHHNSLDLPVEKFEDDEKSITTTYVPLGVVGAICPWNFPLFLAVGKLAPAILSGKFFCKACWKEWKTDHILQGAVSSSSLHPSLLIPL